MAESQFTLCNPLCFLVNKFGKCNVKTLKSSLLDFYTAENLSTAKLQLLKDLEKVKSVSFPHIPQHRQGENRAVREVDDMLLLLTTLDENVKPMSSVLPIYVADSPDNLPSIRIYEGDMGIMMAMIEKMGCKFDLLSSAISTVAQGVHGVQVKLDSMLSSQSTAQHIVPLPQRQPRADEREINKSSHITSRPVSSCQFTSQMTSGNPGSVEAGENSATAAVGKPINSLIGPALPTGSLWSSLVSTPVHDNRRSVMGTTDDDQSDGGQFIEQRSARVRRQRQLTAQQRRQQHLENNQQSQQNLSRRSGAPLVIGKSTIGFGISAARKIVKKAVFCVDNLDTDHSIKDISLFVTSMGISVLSCFEAKPRRRQNEAVVTNRKAFRVCINADDRERFLDDSKWPDSVAVYDWFFRSAQPTQPSAAGGDKRRRIEDDEVNDDDDVTGASLSRHYQSTEGEVRMDHSDNETTIPLDSTVVDPQQLNNGDEC